MSSLSDNNIETHGQEDQKAKWSLLIIIRFRLEMFACLLGFQVLPGIMPGIVQTTVNNVYLFVDS